MLQAVHRAMARAARVKGAQLDIVPDMGHDLPVSKSKRESTSVPSALRVTVTNRSPEASTECGNRGADILSNSPSRTQPSWLGARQCTRMRPPRDESATRRSPAESNSHR